MKTARLNDLEKQQKDINQDIKEEQRHLHTQFKAEYRHFIRAIDIMLIVMVCFNMGAVAITNALVPINAAEQNKTVQYAELNPTQAKLNNYAQPENPPSSLGFFFAVLHNLLFWAILAGVYIYYRNTVYSFKQLLYMLTIAILYLIVTAKDFFNDFGFLAGELILGV